jgi:quinol monooxygenase YgiN
MTAMNVVHMRVKPGKEEEYVRLHRELDIRSMPGARNFWLVSSGERRFVVVGEWDSPETLAAARPAMIANLDKLRPILEDLGGGRGLTEPWSGDVALHMKA